jgi:hypothetical protein
VRGGLILAVLTSLCACTTYHFAQDVKFVGLSSDLHPGTLIGTVKGEDCRFMILGIRLGPYPTLDQALANANQAEKPRYLAHLTSETGGFNLGLFGDYCVQVKGEAYR